MIYAMRRDCVDVFLVGTQHDASANTATSRDVISWRLKTKNKKQKRRLNETSLQLCKKKLKLK